MAALSGAVQRRCGAGREAGEQPEHSGLHGGAHPGGGRGGRSRRRLHGEGDSTTAVLFCAAKYCATTKTRRACVCWLSFLVYFYCRGLVRWQARMYGRDRYNLTPLLIRNCSALPPSPPASRCMTGMRYRGRSTSFASFLSSLLGFDECRFTMSVGGTGCCSSPTRCRQGCAGRAPT